MLGCPCDYLGALGDGSGAAASVCPAANGTHACGAYPIRSLLDDLIKCIPLPIADIRGCACGAGLVGIGDRPSPR